MKFEELKAKRIGIVLSGGGAKGAYEVGCWKALRAAPYNIRVSAISGTSVGALNAVLMATDRFDAANRVWGQIAFSKVFSLSAAQLVRLPLLPLWLLCVVARLLDAPIRVPGPFSRSCQRAVYLFMAAVSVSLSSDTGPFSYAVPLFLLLLVMGPVVKWSILRLTFLTNLPLARTIARELSDQDLAAIKIPTYATLSRFQQEAPLLGDFRWGGWVPDYVRLDRLSPEILRNVILQSAAIPGLFPVRRVLGDEAIDGGWCDNVPLAPLLYDPDASCDVVFVIHLDEKAGRPPVSVGDLFWYLLGETPERMPSTHRLEREASRRWNNYLRATVIRVYDTLEEWAPSSPVHARIKFVDVMDYHSRSTPRVVHIVPSKDLGDFLTGTLWFFGAKARRLIRLGEDDMKQALESIIAEMPA